MPLRHQTGTNGIFSHILPFLRVTFVVSQEVIKKLEHLKELLLSTDLDLQLALERIKKP